MTDTPITPEEHCAYLRSLKLRVDPVPLVVTEARLNVDDLYRMDAIAALIEQQQQQIKSLREVAGVLHKLWYLYT